MRLIFLLCSAWEGVSRHTPEVTLHTGQACSGMTPEMCAFIRGKQDRKNCMRNNMSKAITHTAAGALVAWGTGEQWPLHPSFWLLQMWPPRTPVYYVALRHWPSQTIQRNWCMGLPPFLVVVKFGAWRMGEIISIWGAQELYLSKHVYANCHTSDPWLLHTLLLLGRQVAVFSENILIGYSSIFWDRKHHVQTDQATDDFVITYS